MPAPRRTAAALLCLALGACERGTAGDAPEAASPAAAEASAGVPLEAVRGHPHDPTSFTQGLVHHGGFLYESTGGRGRSKLRQLEVATGRVVREVAIPAPYFAEGIAVLGERLYQLTWQENTAFVYDLATLERTGTFAYEGEGWGLAADGRSLVMSDGTSTLRFLDPATFRTVRSLEVTDGGLPVQSLNELEWVRGELWANVWHDDRIARIDPATGRVKGWLSLAGLVPTAALQSSEAVANGIAFDEATGRLFVTGKLWPVLYEVRLPE